jgi:hypothetical protein
LVEVDACKFWKMVNAKRKNKRSLASTGINFNGSTVRDRDHITEGWCDYFRKLYTTDEDRNYYEEWKNESEQDLNSIVQNLRPGYDVIVLSEEVKAAIEQCPRQKSAGVDNVQYEHLLYAKETFSPVLANIFTSILRMGYVPDCMKRGVIVTLHKGLNKRKYLPDNYRAITLTSVILKLFESVLLTRSKLHVISTLIRQQGGFQDGYLAS